MDIPVETSTCAFGNQYQNGQTDNFTPKPKKNNKYIQYTSLKVNLLVFKLKKKKLFVKTTINIVPIPTNIEPKTAQPAKNNEASIPPLEFADKYIEKNTKISINS